MPSIFLHTVNNQQFLQSGNVATPPLLQLRAGAASPSDVQIYSVNPGVNSTLTNYNTVDLILYAVINDSPPVVKASPPSILITLYPTRIPSITYSGSPSSSEIKIQSFDATPGTVKLFPVSQPSQNTQQVNTSIDLILYNQFGSIYSLALSDSISFSDAISKTQNKALADSISFSDQIATQSTFNRILSDSITFTDTISKNTTKSLADYITFTDSFFKTFSQFLADNIAFTDQIVKNFGLFKSDSISFSDKMTMNRLMSLYLSDSITFVDSISKNLQITKADAISFTDRITSRHFDRIMKIVDSISVNGLNITPSASKELILTTSVTTDTLNITITIHKDLIITAYSSNELNIKTSQNG